MPRKNSRSEIPVFVLGKTSLARNIVIYKALLEIGGRITNPISLSGWISPNRLLFVGVPENASHKHKKARSEVAFLSLGTYFLCADEPPAFLFSFRLNLLGVQGF